MLRRLAVILLAGAMLVLALGAQTPNAPGKRISVSIDAGKTAQPISPYIYGQFIEHIGDLINRSVWAEIVPTGNIELNENMELASPLSSPPPGARGASYLSRRRFSCLQVSSHAPPGESRTSAPTRSAATLGEAAFPYISRSTPVGVAVRSLERLAVRPGYCQAGDRYWLAPQRLPAVLDLEGSPWSARPAADWCRSTSSPSRPSGRKPPSQNWRTFLENHVKTSFRSCTCSWFWLTTEGGSCIST